MKINITSGEELNNLYKNKKEVFIPFNEAIINGPFNGELFSEEFIESRVKALNTTKEIYLEKLNPFINFYNNLDKYDEVNLYFGYEPFCRANTKFILNALRKKDYQGKVVLNIVDELDGHLLVNATLDLYNEYKEIDITAIYKEEREKLKDLYENPILHTCDLKLNQKFVSLKGEKPNGMCDSAWNNLEIYVYLFSLGGSNLFDGWMKNANQAVISCNDGIRPVSFLIEKVIN